MTDKAPSYMSLSKKPNHKTKLWPKMMLMIRAENKVFRGNKKCEPCDRESGNCMQKPTPYGERHVVYYVRQGLCDVRESPYKSPAWLYKVRLLH